MTGISIGAPLEIAKAAAPGQDLGDYETLASGIATTPVTIAHDGNQHGIQLTLMAAGVRALLGLPTAALGASLVGLDELLGGDARFHRSHRMPAWPASATISQGLRDEDYGSHGFTCRDPEGVYWSLGMYAGE